MPGEAKNTYGTGCFMLLNTGPRVREIRVPRLFVCTLGMLGDLMLPSAIPQCRQSTDRGGSCCGVGIAGCRADVKPKAAASHGGTARPPHTVALATLCLQAIPSTHGLLTTVAFKLGTQEATQYALEGGFHWTHAEAVFWRRLVEKAVIPCPLGTLCTCTHAGTFWGTSTCL